MSAMRSRYQRRPRIFVRLKLSGMPARAYRARETLLCGACLTPIRAGLLYTLRSPHGNRRAKEPRCFCCCPWTQRFEEIV